MAKVLNGYDYISPTAKLILLGIANHDGDGGSWPSVKTLARYANTSPRNAQKHIRSLEEFGIIERDLNAGGTHRTAPHARPNLYRIIWTPPVTSDTPPPVTSDTRTILEPSTEPSTPQSPPTTEVEVVPEWEVFFNHFWEAYPRKIAKPAAKRAMKAKYGSFDTHAMADSTNAWVRFWVTSQTEEQYIPHPSTFLNQERYNDEPPKIDEHKKESAMDIIARIAARDS